MSPQAPQGEAIARYLAVHPPLLDELTPETPCLWSSTVVVWMEERYGAIRDLHVWTHPTADAGRVAFALGTAHGALHDPDTWSGSWERHGLEGDRTWLLRLDIVGDELLPEQADV